MSLEGSVGENMAWSGSSSYGGAAATDSWYNEVTDPGYDYALDGGAEGKPASDDNPDTGHFTQVVWKATTKIGCGYKEGCNIDMSVGPMKTVWVCQCVHAPAHACAPHLPAPLTRTLCLARRYQVAGNFRNPGYYETNVLNPSTCPSFDASSCR